MPSTLEAGGREPNATYFGSGRARALRSCAVISNVYRAARAAPLQENNYLGSKVSGLGLAPTTRKWPGHRYHNMRHHELTAQ